MRLSHLDKKPYPNPTRRHSPNALLQKNNPNLSVHSEHLWNMMEDIELFPEEIYQLLRHEQRNLGNYKRSIEREKQKVGQSIDSLKREMQHNIDDLKISIFAQLDRIYRFYMQKYATLKGEIMQIKRLKDEIEINIEARSNNYAPKYTPSRDNDNNKYSFTNNASIMKSMEKNSLEVKKYQMLNYIAELQREKIMPLSELTNELTILTQYENGYYQHKEFQGVMTSLIESLKANLRSIYERKYEFIRQPEQICQKEEKPILDELYQPPVLAQNIYQVASTPTIRPPAATIPSPSNMYQDMRKFNQTQQQPQVTKLEQTKFIGIANDQQNITYEWAENVSLIPTQSIKSVAEDIILCALEVTRNTIAVGSKDGVITIYDTNTGQKVANLRGHKSSICKLAIVSNNGKKYLASGSDHGCSAIVLWDISTWNMRMRIEYHKAAVTAILDLQDNRSLISGSYDKTINVYNLNNQGKILFNLPINRTSVTAVLMSCNGNKLITCGLDDSVCVYQIMRGVGRQVQTMFLQREIQNNTMICSIVASLINPDLVFLGTKDGKIKLINIDRGEAYKTYGVCNNAVIQMLVVERQTKPEFPIAICWPCSQESLKIVNTQSGKINTQATKGFIEFGCGIGPKSFFLSSGRNVAMLSQSKQRRQINMFRLQAGN